MRGSILIGLFVVMGCNGIEEGRPVRSPLEEGAVKSLLLRYKDPTAWDAKTEQDRNRITDDMLFLVDKNYYLFESQLYTGSATFETVMDLALISVGAVGTLIAGPEVKSILAATSSGLAGARASVSRNFLQEQTIFALVAKMRAGRIRKLEQIRRMKLEPLATYSPSMALSDVEEYYNVGTIVGALRAVVTEAGEEVMEAERNR